MRAQSLLIASLVLTLVSFMPSSSLVSPALAEEAEDDPMTILWECLDSDTLGECVNCCLDEFLDEPGLFYVCVEECSIQCDPADKGGHPNPPHRISPSDTGSSEDEKPAGLKLEEEDGPKDIIADCLDSDTLGECVNCCLDEFLDEPGLFYVCVEECSDQCETDLSEEGLGWSPTDPDDAHDPELYQ